jgi:putative addiction module CopG family antidote
VEVRLTPEQEAMIQRAVAEGRLARPEEALQKALVLWEEYEQRRAELNAMLEEVEASIEAGRYTDYDDETTKTLADELISEARATRCR